MDVLSWIIIGALAGWVAGLVAGTNRQQVWLENISLGIIGACLGGIPFRLLAGQRTDGDGSIGSIILAVVGALVLSAILQLVRRAEA